MNGEPLPTFHSTWVLVMSPAAPVGVNNRVFFTNDQGETFVIANSAEFTLLHVNKLNALAAPNYPMNSRFTGGNWVWIVIGTIFLILAVIGTLMPDQ